MNKNRVEALSDGVFAIVDHAARSRYPHSRGRVRRAGSVACCCAAAHLRLCDQLRRIGVYWLAHHQSLQLVGKLNGWLIWLNLIYLLAVSFMPVPTALLGRYLMEPILIVIYGLNLIVANSIGRVVSWYLRAHPELGSGYVHRASHKGFYLYIFVNASYVLAMVLGFFAPIVSYAIFVVVLLVVIVFYSFTPVASHTEQGA